MQPMLPPPLSGYARAASQAARAAGRLLAQHAGKPATVAMKRGINDLVTNIDRASEQAIHRILHRAYPGFGFLGEERGGRRSASPYQWIVDPLDGTTNFVHGVPCFGVSIGLVHEGVRIVGVICDPIRRQLFVAAQGHGAFLNGKRLRVSRHRTLATSLLATGFSAKFRRHPQPYARWFHALESRTQAVRRMGSTALCLAYVAAGWLDGFYERDLWPWDVAAGLLLVEEAGGRVTDFDGRSVVLSDGRVAASNGWIHEELLRVLRGTSVTVKGWRAFESL
ncbi:MAG: inositol monophosphatase [Candidatus Omnitrophica bacterium]|nr:inositol monophosphatase [Candidatus Omnitrophota bacterium]